MISFTKWQKYNSLIGKYHYTTLHGSNYEAKLELLGRGGTAKNKGYYQITVSDGYKVLALMTKIGLNESKTSAMELLTHCFNESKGV